jgi:hypothetical protein
MPDGWIGFDAARIEQLIDAIIAMMQSKGAIAVTERELEQVADAEGASLIEMIVATAVMVDRARRRVAH